MRPCRCWTKTWSQHDGHCCFAPDSPEDCHDAEVAARAAEAARAGSMMRSRYWLTEAGWAAARAVSP